MRKMFVVAARDYQAAVKTKSFVVGLLIMPLMMGGSILVQWLLKDVQDVREKRFAVVDRSPSRALAAALVEKANQRNEKEIYDPQTGKQVKPRFTVEIVEPSSDDLRSLGKQRYELSERVREGGLFGFLEIGPDVYRATASGSPPDERAGLRYQSNSPTYGAFYDWAEKVVNDSVQKQRFAELKLPAEQVETATRPVPLRTKGLSKYDAVKDDYVEAPDENRAASFLIPAGMMMLMFMMVLLGASPLLQGVVEEKMQRIAEVLLGSIPPFQLMMGKILGMVGVSLTLAVVYLGGAYWSAARYGFADFLPAGLLVWFVVYLVLAVMMFGSLFIAVGAACTDMKETQNLLWPVMLLASAPMFVLGHVLQEPNSTLSQGLSFVPTATPMLMIARQAVPPGIDVWQPLAGVALVLATTVGFVYAAGRIFRVGILLHGKGARVGDLFKWVVRG